MKRLFVLLLLFFYFKSNAQCAMCRAVLETADGKSAAEGINDGIVYLMAVPYILVAGVGILIYLKFRTQNK